MAAAASPTYLLCDKISRDGAFWARHGLYGTGTRTPGAVSAGRLDNALLRLNPFARAKLLERLQRLGYPPDDGRVDWDLVLAAAAGAGDDGYGGRPMSVGEIREIFLRSGQGEVVTRHDGTRVRLLRHEDDASAMLAINARIADDCVKAGGTLRSDAGMNWWDKAGQTALGIVGDVYDATVGRAAEDAETRINRQKNQLIGAGLAITGIVILGVAVSRRS